jgi:hypothetical protein
MPMWLPFLRKRLDELPTASTDNRGFLVTLKSAAGVADKLYWSRKTVADAYELTELGAATHTHTLSQITDDGTMAAQNANAVVITGGEYQVATGRITGTSNSAFVVEQAGGSDVFRINTTAREIVFEGVLIKSGNGTPEGVVAAIPGSLFLRQDGGAGTTLYTKESGVGTNTGWVGK